MAATSDYPDDAPVESVREIVRLLREGKAQAESAAFAKHVWLVQGYLQRMTMGTPMQFLGARNIGTDEEMCTTLEYLVDKHQTAKTVPLAAMLRWLLGKLTSECLTK